MDNHTDWFSVVIGMAIMIIVIWLLAMFHDAFIVPAGVVNRMAVPVRIVK